MAKLYWRIKRDGKWTWIAATPENTSWCTDTFPWFTGTPLKILDIDGHCLGDPQELFKPEVYSDDSL